MPNPTPTRLAADRAPKPAFAERLGERRRRHAGRSYPYRIVFAIAGFSVLAVGAAMLVLPGPGLPVTALGLGMLALEFRWAERLLLRAVRLGEAGRDRLRSARRHS